MQRKDRMARMFPYLKGKEYYWALELDAHWLGSFLLSWSQGTHVTLVASFVDPSNRREKNESLQILQIASFTHVFFFYTPPSTARSTSLYFFFASESAKKIATTKAIEKVDHLYVRERLLMDWDERMNSCVENPGRYGRSYRGLQLKCASYPWSWIMSICPR
jgi:hypothetical protein